MHRTVLKFNTAILSIAAVERLLYREGHLDS